MLIAKQLSKYRIALGHRGVDTNDNPFEPIVSLHIDDFCDLFGEQIFCKVKEGSTEIAIICALVERTDL